MPEWMWKSAVVEKISKTMYNTDIVERDILINPDDCRRHTFRLTAYTAAKDYDRQLISFVSIGTDNKTRKNMRMMVT